MKKTSYNAPMFESKDFVSYTNEFGTYEMTAEASTLGLKPGEKPYSYLGDHRTFPRMAIKSHKTGKIRIFKLIQESATGWLFAPADSEIIPMVKIFND